MLPTNSGSNPESFTHYQPQQRRNKMSISQDYLTVNNYTTDAQDGDEEDSIHTEEFAFYGMELNHLVSGLMIVDQEHFDSEEKDLRYHVSCDGQMQSDGWIVLTDRPRRNNYSVSRPRLNNWIDQILQFREYQAEELVFTFDD
jgi:hypothetical protein